MNVKAPKSVHGFRETWRCLVLITREILHNIHFKPDCVCGGNYYYWVALWWATVPTRSARESEIPSRTGVLENTRWHTRLWYVYLTFNCDNSIVVRLNDCFYIRGRYKWTTWQKSLYMVWNGHDVIGFFPHQVDFTCYASFTAGYPIAQCNCAEYLKCVITHRTRNV